MAKKSLTAEVLAQEDKNLFGVIIKMGVKPGSKQLINWYIYAKDFTHADTLVGVLKKVMPGLSCFTRYSIEIVQQSDGECTILITTSDFMFKIENVLKYSRMLYDIATKNGGNYDFWEIEIDSNKL